MESNDEIQELEAKAEQLNEAMADADEEQQAEIQSTLEGIYSRLDQLDASSAEARATQILFGLGFTTKMQSMKTKEFSGGWRMVRSVVATIAVVAVGSTCVLMYSCFHTNTIESCARSCTVHSA